MNLLTAREAAEYLHVSLFTLGRMEKEALLVPYRTPGGHRRYSVEMLDEYLERSRATPAKRRARVLVVHDGQELADLLAPAFPSCGFTTATDELDVGMKIAQFQPDVVVVNTAMSGLNGRDLCRRLDNQGIGLQVVAFATPEERADTGGGPNPVQGVLSALKEGIEGALRDV